MAKTLEVVDGAVVTATTIDREAKTFTGCVYDADGMIVRSSQRTSRNVSWKPTDPERIDVEFVSGELDRDCLYLGHYTAHYGHFLLETLARFWALRSPGDFGRFLFHPFVHQAPRPRAFSPARVCLECFGVDLRHVSVVRKPMRVRRLAVPASMVEINNSADPRQSAVYRRIATCCAEHRNAGGHSARLYLSRRRVGRYRLTERSKGYQPFTNEDEVEALFESLGFRVMHPERVDFTEQVAMYGEADVVAGYPGSALHNAVFMKPRSRLVKVGSPRHRSIANPNQRMCEELGEVRAEFLPFEGRIVDWDQRLGEVDIERLRGRLEALLASS